ncbi:hypothetical protein SY27_12100 [Flavobacterium sp. 316]|uniref:hypothetical protein n=1 Tax=Flavobacterium sp. 316 TaxID=1603293 RepID=UPI0005E5E311|nr:hypothetical protein [Flavobacterium sp. 316]KIX20637.1 hypothetical protein SY27_12100 [Flavobacterium sp. 316]
MKNYVSKLIDRNLQKKRESGITSYVLYSVLILVLYKITQLYPEIPFKKNFWDVLKIITPTFNICLGLFFILSIYFETTKHISSIRVKLNTNKRNLLDEFLIILVILLPLGFSILLAYHEYFHLKTYNWYSIIISVLEGLFFIITFLFLLYGQKQINKIEITEGSSKINDDRDSFSIIIYLLSFFIITYSIISLFGINSNIPKLSVFIFSILFYSVFFIILKIFQLKEGDNLIKALENFEYEINVKNISENDIKIGLQKNYFGFLINDWITYNYQLISSFETGIDKEIANLEIRKEKLSKKNNTRAEELDIKKLEIDVIRKKSDFYVSKIKEVDSFCYNSEIERKDQIELLDLRETLVKKLRKNKLYFDN